MNTENKIPLAVLLSDLHFTDKPLWSSLPACTGDCDLALRCNLTLAAELGVPVILAGDIFNQQTITPKGVKKFFKIVKEFPGIQLLYINGNHDRGADSYCDLGELFAEEGNSAQWLKLTAEPLTVEVHNTSFTVVGVPYTPAGHITETLRSLPKDVNFLVMHQTPKQFFSLEGVYDMDLEELPENLSNYRGLLFGDVHKPQVKGKLVDAVGVKKEMTDETVEWVVSAGGQLWAMGGTPYIWRVDEAKYPHYMNVISVNKEFGYLQYTQTPIPHRRHLNVVINTPEDRDKFPEFVEQSCAPVEGLAPVYSVTYREDIPHVQDTVERAVRSNGAFLFAHPLTMSLLEQRELAIDENTEAFSLDKCLVSHIQKEFKDDPEIERIQSFCQSLLHAQNREAVFEEFRELSWTA